VLGIAHNTLCTLANIAKFSRLQSRQHISMCFNGTWTKIKPPVPAYNSFGDENLSKKVKYQLQNFDLYSKKYEYTPKRMIRDMRSKMHTFDMQYAYQNTHFKICISNNGCLGYEWIGYHGRWMARLLMVGGL
jgi:hypothetical protein